MMAYTISSLFFIIILYCWCIHDTTNAHEETSICHLEAIYQFGDSISDTGNLILEGPVGASSVSAHLPYGETYFHRPTGRFCNGRIIIDFIANAFGLPFLNPYLEENADKFGHGVNFAVAGSTALDDSFFTARNISIPSTNAPLSLQMIWFKTHLNSICDTPAECAAKLKGSVVMMGEVGGNDYNYAFFQGKSVEEIQTYVPYVISTITKAIREVIRLGATQIIVPGIFPDGCFPCYLTSFHTSDPNAYDDMGCLIYLNEFAEYHNNYLQKALALLRQEYLQITLLYSDYYTAFLSVFRSASYLGFDEQTLLQACCGTGGEYNYNESIPCGYPEVPVCPNSAKYINWDGVHLTQKTYHHMSDILISHICPHYSSVPRTGLLHQVA